jgi:hypothetical protein
MGRGTHRGRLRGYGGPVLYLIRWLGDVRAALPGEAEAARWRRVVDGLAAAGDNRAPGFSKPKNDMASNSSVHPGRIAGGLQLRAAGKKGRNPPAQVHLGRAGPLEMQGSLARRPPDVNRDHCGLEVLPTLTPKLTCEEASSPLSLMSDDDFKASIQTDIGIKPMWAAEAFTDLDADVRQSIARIKASPFIPYTDQIRGFVFDVTTGLLREVK